MIGWLDLSLTCVLPIYDAVTGYSLSESGIRELLSGDSTTSHRENGVHYSEG